MIIWVCWGGGARIIFYFALFGYLMGKMLAPRFSFSQEKIFFLFSFLMEVLIIKLGVVFFFFFSQGGEGRGCLLFQKEVFFLGGKFLGLWIFNAIFLVKIWVCGNNK